MKWEYLTDGKAKTATVFFAGWGMDKRPFLNAVPIAGDLIFCWDYTSLECDLSFLERYEKKRVMAWSMGVWAAGQILQEMPFDDAIAINGTPWPIDDRRGIPEAVFNATLEGLTDESLIRFYRRMCGSPDVLRAFLNVRPQRTIDDLRTELASIGEASRRLPPTTFGWSHAWIGRNDRIFPAAAQELAWQDVPHTVTDDSHYPLEHLHYLLTEVYG